MATRVHLTLTARFDPNQVTTNPVTGNYNLSLSLGSPSTWGNYAETLTLPRVIQFSLRMNSEQAARAARLTVIHPTI